MSILLNAIVALTELFDKYAKDEGDSATLTKKEMAKMFRNELGDVGDKAAMDDFFKLLDADGDGVVNFTEYITFVASMAAIIRR